ncbi:MAG: hypothetical protein AB1752_11630 [Candidatus Zixiibacteriota bacterium]
MKTVERTKEGWRVSHFEPPLVLSAERFPTEKAVRLWLDSTEGKAFADYRVGRIALAKKVTPIHRRVAFEEGMAGAPENPEAPKPSESMEGLMDRVWSAMRAKGWNAWDNPGATFDFGVLETYTDFIIAQDYKTQETYKIAFTDDGTSVTFGDPEEYEVTYQKVEGGDGGDTEPTPEPTPDPDAMQMSRCKVRIKGKAIVLSKKGEDSKGNPKYEMLLCQSGETEDGRFVTDNCIRDAVAAGLWDGARSYLSHPDPDTGKRTSEIACALVVPGTVRAEKNPGNGLDAIGTVVVFNTIDGKDVAEALDMGLEYKVPVIGTSVFSESAFKRRGEANGKEYSEIIERFERIDAQDFVDDPAFSRAVARGRVAASRNGNGDELTMDEKQKYEERIAALEKQNKENADKLVSLQREKDVKAELAASGLDQETQDILEPILLENPNPKNRAATIALQRHNMLKNAKRSNPGGGPQDGGNGSDDDADEPNLPPDAKAALDRNAKNAGIKPEFLKLARQKRGQRAEQGVTAD